MELTIDDLIEKCEMCGGTGQEKQATEQISGLGGQSIGRRVIATVPMNSSCQACSGTGRMKLTSTGEVIKDFLAILKKRHMI